MKLDWSYLLVSRAAIACVAALALAACYGSAPPKPPRATAPSLIEGAQILVSSEQRTSYERVAKEAKTCPSGQHDSRDCAVTSYSSTEPVTRVYSSATYGEQPITYAQFKVLADPHYDDKLARLDRLRKRCSRANVPRYLGYGLLIGGGLLVPSIGAATQNNTVMYTAMYGVLGAGAASLALGYYVFGGRDCKEARAIYDDVNVEPYMNSFTVVGGNFASEMQELATRFNANRPHTSAMRMR